MSGTRGPRSFFCTLASALAVAIALASSLDAAAQGRYPDRIVKKLDKNGDGKVSLSEWPNPREAFKAIDRNRDGYLTADEFAAHWGITPAGQQRAVAAPTVVDVHVHIFEAASTSVKQRLAMNFDAATDRAISVMDRHNVRVSVIMPTPSLQGLFDADALFREAKRHPGRFVVLAGGGTLNPILHKVPAGKVTNAIKRDFEAKAESLLRAGAAGFGEMAALHFSYFRYHPFEEVQPDHPLLLLLADIAARHGVPIDLHCEIAPRDIPVSPKLINRSAKNPHKVHANLAALDRLLAHNPKAQIILSHSIDATGFRTAAIIRGLIERHPNMAMSLNDFPNYLIPENLAIKPGGTIPPDWQQLIKDHPDRFMVGSDQRYSSPCQNCKMPDRVGPSRRWADLLPPDIARMVAHENAARIFHISRAP